MGRETADRSPNRAAEAVGSRIPTGFEPLARLLRRAEGLASSNVEGVRAPNSGWAAATVHRSLAEVLLRSHALLALGLTAAVVATPSTRDHRWWAIPCLLALIATSAVGRPGPRRVRIVALATAPLAVGLPAAAGPAITPVALGAIWLLHVTQTVPTVHRRGLWEAGVSVVVALAPLSLRWLQPTWTELVTIPWTVTSLLLAGVAWWVLPQLLGFAAALDGEIDAEQAERRAVARIATASAEAAESARLLHDTAVNTLAAVTAGGAAVADPELVRARCRRDLDALDALRSGTSATGSPEVFEDVVARTSLRVARQGLSGPDLADALDRLPEEQVRALQRSVGEALRNVEKHAGTDRADLVVTVVDDELSVEVIDDGVGFDGQVVEGRGLARSVFERARHAGIAVRLDTAPGSGTTVGFRCRLGARGSVDRANPTSDQATAAPKVAEVVIEDIAQRANWLWSAGVVGVGIGLEVLGRPGQWSTIYPMLVVVAAVSLLARWSVRGGRPLPTAMAAAIVASMPVAYVLVAASIDFGRHDPTSWQAIAITPGLLTLAVYRCRLALALAVGAIVGAAVATTVVVARTDPAAAAFLPVGAVPAVLVGLSADRFRHLLDRLGRRSAAAHAAVAAARLERAARQAALDAAGRWRVDGVDGAAELLGGIASGALDPASPDVQRRCADAEMFLRQLCLLDPALYRSGDGLARALSDARRHGVALTVRTSTTEVDSDEAATRLCDLLCDTVGTLPAGSSVTATLFPSEGRPTFTLVAPAAVLDGVAAAWTPPSNWRVRIDHHGDVGVLGCEPDVGTTAGESSSQGAARGLPVPG